MASSLSWAWSFYVKGNNSSIMVVLLGFGFSMKTLCVYLKCVAMWICVLSLLIICILVEILK